MKRRKVTRPTKTWAEIKREARARTAKEILRAEARVDTPWGDKTDLFQAALAKMSPEERLEAWHNLVIYGTAMIWHPPKGKPVLVPPMELLIAKQTIPSISAGTLRELMPKRGRK